MKPRDLAPLEYLEQCFRYEPTSGEIRWRFRPIEHFTTRARYVAFNRRLFDSIAGHKIFHRGGMKKCISIWLTFNGELLRFGSHRIAAALCGINPDGKKIDHKNGDPFDNRIGNLRVATDAQNQYNHPSHKVGGASRALPKGVSRVNLRFRADIKENKRSKYLGTFATPEEAHVVYATEAVRIFGKFARMQ